MTKRSGFAVKITAFIEADPKNMKGMLAAGETIAGIAVLLKQAGFIQQDVQSRFMLSREVPDEPKPAEAQDSVQSTMPPLPTAMRRT